MKLRVCAPDIFPGDAVGNHCLGVARVAEQLDLEVHLYAERFDATTAPIRPLRELFAEARAEDLLLVSYSIVDPFLEQLLALPCRKICYFHGVTDPDLLREFEPRTAELCAAAQAQFPLLARFDVVIANSRSTADCVAQWIEPASIKVIPPVFADMPVFQRAPSCLAPHGPRSDLMVVGRVVPHKCVEDAIDVLAHLHRRDVKPTLSIIGNMPNFDYSKFLINRARRAGVLDYVNFMGMVDDDDLLDRYDASSGLLVMSRHEGFCVPVLEAMHFGKPVFVRGGTAAHELCAPSSVFDSGTPLDVWADAVAARLVMPASDQGRLANSETKRANEILQRTNIRVWQRVFLGDRERGTP